MEPSPFLTIWREEEEWRKARKRLKRLGIEPPPDEPRYVTTGIGQWVQGTVEPCKRGAVEP
jgi:hypothetical protein